MNRPHHALALVVELRKIESVEHQHALQRGNPRRVAPLPDDPAIGIGTFGLRSDFTFAGPVVLVPAELFAPGVLDVDLFGRIGVLLDGSITAPRQRAFAIGTVTLDEAGTEDGDPVSGHFDLELYWL